MDFSEALKCLRRGFLLCRNGWNGKGMYIFMEPSTEDLHSGHFIPRRPYIAMYTADNQIVPWVASQTDLLADDWVMSKSEFPCNSEPIEDNSNEFSLKHKIAQDKCKKEMAAFLDAYKTYSLKMVKILNDESN